MAMGQGVSVWVLDAPSGLGAAEYHAHHAIQITVALDGQLALATEGFELCAAAMAVKADSLHRIEASGLLAFVFVEPESRSGRALSEVLFRERPLVELSQPDVTRMLAPLKDTFAARLTNAHLLAAGRSVVDGLAPSTPARLPDPRIQRIIEYATAHLHEPMSLASAAHGVHLSPSRLRHLFVEHTGVAFKTYLLWLRLIRAVQLYSEGTSSLTDAAHEAGFADSAHFSRIFKRTFGSPATTLRRF